MNPKDDDTQEPTSCGYTFAEWLRCAGRQDSASYCDLRAAWRAGELPDDYRQESP
jgi:hypothetical protein